MPFNMLWQAKSILADKIQAYAYRIDALLLAKDNQQKWTNLGLWQENETDYVTAAHQLAYHMGQSLVLTPQYKILDVGCGYGASIRVWRDDFAIQNISVVELQPICCNYLVYKHQALLTDIFQQSIFSAKPSINKNLYDVVMSIDAAYHSALQCYLDAIAPWLAEKGQVGFHVLMKSDAWQNASAQQKNALQQKLKWAKVDAAHLLTHAELNKVMQHNGYQHIQIQDLTQQVLGGFSDYMSVHALTWRWREKCSIAALKIYLTARLCHDLAHSGLIHYVQVTAQK